MALIIELFLIGVGLSMDAFAVSICKGLGMEKINKKQAFTIGLYFGGFQALMPLIGWFLGIRFQQYITSIDHWIAFILLVCIGGKMVVEAVRDRDHEVVGKKNQPLDHKEMFLLAVATSIDALAVGITFALLDTPICNHWLYHICTFYCGRDRRQFLWNTLQKEGGDYRRNYFNSDWIKNTSRAFGHTSILKNWSIEDRTKKGDYYDRVYYKLRIATGNIISGNWICISCKGGRYFC